MNLQKIRNDFVYFCTECFGIMPFKWQTEVAEAKSWQKITICGRGSGKSWLARHLTYWFAICNPKAIILYVCPALHQAVRTQREKMFDELRASKLSSSVIKDLATEIKFSNGSQILTLPNEAANIRGYQPNTFLDSKGVKTMGAMAVIIEEACFFNNSGEIIKAVEYPLWNLPPEKRMFLIVSSPAGKNSPIYSLYKAGLEPNPDVKSFTVPSWENPNFEKDRAKVTRGKSSDEIAQEIEAKFCESSGSFFGDLVDDCIFDGTFEGTFTTAIGIDLSLSGSKHGDYSALSVVAKSKDIYAVLETRARRDYTQKELIETIETLCQKYKPVKVMIETYQGQGLVEQLIQRQLPAELLFPTSEFQNMNFHKLRSLIENRQVLLPKRETELIEEFKDFGYSLTASGKKTFSAPAGCHDDRLYASLYAFSALFSGYSLTGAELIRELKDNLESSPTLESMRSGWDFSNDPAETFLQRRERERVENDSSNWW